jgi:transposase
VIQVEQELGVSDHSLYKWRKQARVDGELAFPGNGRVALTRVALTVEQQENVRLKKELERVTQERDILRKAPLYPTRSQTRSKVRRQVSNSAQRWWELNDNSRK